MQHGAPKSAKSNWPAGDEPPARYEFVARLGQFSRRSEFQCGSLVGPGNAPDTDLMRWAIEHDHVLVTADLDFGAILAATRARRPSVLQLRSDILTTGAIGGAVLSALRQAHQDLLDGALVSVDASRARLRILPLRD